jgi:unsaturated chondroitin disaccharide hydrolase
MMNLPQLYFASKELNDDRFKAIAVRHANMAMRDHIRPDGSVNHIVMHDMKEPRVIETLGGQGYGVGSSWSRGQAWALYGFALSYIHTGDEAYLDTAKRVANYFISCVAATDYLPLIDFRAPDEPVYYDSTAGAIAACGLIEIAKSVPEYEKGVYLDAAIKMLKAMEEKWCDWTEKEDSILQMGSERYGSEMHMPIIYGDYFFAEAVIKLRGSEFLPW